MELRLALYQLAAQEGLSPPGIQRLLALAGLEGEPASLRRRLPRGVALLAAVLGGLAVVFWIAAHWGSLGRAGQFALLQGLLVAAALGAWRFPVARVPLALLAWLDLGGLLAFFGQTYQTGADPWQLFALWALLSLPLALAVRSDALWLPWALVALTGVALWMQTFMVWRAWWDESSNTGIQLIGCLAGAAVVAVLAPAARRWTGAGDWGLRGAIALWTVLVSSTALYPMLQRQAGGSVWLGALMLGTAFGALAVLRKPDIPGLSTTALGFNVLVVAGAAHVLTRQISVREWEGPLFVCGLVAIVLLTGTAKAILALARRQEEQA